MLLWLIVGFEPTLWQKHNFFIFCLEFLCIFSESKSQDPTQEWKEVIKAPDQAKDTLGLEPTEKSKEDTKNITAEITTTTSTTPTTTSSSPTSSTTAKTTTTQIPGIFNNCNLIFCFDTLFNKNSLNFKYSESF
jgi:hypothetical protein